MKWEYNTVFDHDLGECRDKYLNALGEAGWELVAATNTGEDSEGDTAVKMYFKRPLPEEPPRTPGYEHH